MRKAVHHAYETTPYYYDTFQRLGIRPDEVTSAEDLGKLPTIERSDIILNYPHQIISRGTVLSDCWTISTSGTTGRKGRIAYSKRDRDWHRIALRRIYSMCGLNMFEKAAELTCMSKETIGRLSSQPSVPKGFLRLPKLYNHRTKDFALNPQNEAQQVVELLKYGPKGMHGFPSAFRQLGASFPEAVKKLNLKGIVAGGEILDKPNQRFLEETYETTLLDNYGMREFGNIATECEERQGLHIHSDLKVLEVIKEGEQAAPGELGEIVVTKLFAEAMPLIRYKTGDMGILDGHDCSCGRGLPLLKRIEGRKCDFLTSVEGLDIPPKLLLEPLGELVYGSRMQIVQKKNDYICIRCERELSNSEQVLALNIARSVLGEELRVEFEVEDLRVHPKFKNIRNEIYVVNEARRN